MSFLLRTTRFAPRSIPQLRQFTTSRVFAVKVDSHFISQITAAEKKLTNSDDPIKGGPTAKAQIHLGQELNPKVVHDITQGEKLITNSDEPVQGGPTSVAQSLLSSSGSATQGRGNNAATANARSANSNLNSNSNSVGAQPSGKLDSQTMSKITDAEKKLTGADGPVQGGPTSKAQQHAGEPITSQALHDITEGEKKITGGERVKGGPTSKAQSELGKSRQA